MFGALLLLVVGCSAEATTRSRPVETPELFVRSVTDARCEQRLECDVSTSYAPPYLDIDECVAAEAHAVRRELLLDLDLSVEIAAKYDPVLARECIRRLADDDCATAARDLRRIESCVAALTGGRADGAPCTSPSQCTGGACVGPNAGCAVCATLAGVGGNCMTAADCRAADDGDVRCDAGACTLVPDPQSTAPGEVVFVGPVQCVAGSVAVALSAGGTTCRDRAGVGAECTRSADCLGGLSCAASTARCVAITAVRTEGSPCGTTAWGLTCDWPASAANGVCAEISTCS